VFFGNLIKGLNIAEKYQLQTAPTERMAKTFPFAGLVSGSTFKRLVGSAVQYGLGARRRWLARSFIRNEKFERSNDYPSFQVSVKKFG
jgi:hypothetical protein